MPTGSLAREAVLTRVDAPMLVKISARILFLFSFILFGLVCSRMIMADELFSALTANHGHITYS